MSKYDSLIKATKADGYSEEEVNREITDGIDKAFLIAKEKGIDPEVVKAKISTLGVPSQLYTDPASVGGDLISRAEKAADDIRTSIGAVAATAKKGLDVLGETPEKAAAAMVAPKPEAAAAPDHPLNAIVKAAGVKMGVRMAKEQFDKVYGPTAGRFVSDFTAGMVGTADSFAGAARWLGADEMGLAFSKRAQEIQQELIPPDPKFIDQVAQGFGSMAVFYVPGIGVQAGAARLALFAPRMASWLGVGASAVLEATAEAGSVYGQSLEKAPDDKDLANKRASAVFWGNLPTLLITDKLGVFGESGSVARQALVASLMEGGQEGSQSILANIAMNDPMMKGVIESFGVGAIVGGGIAGGAAVVQGKPATVRTVEGEVVEPSPAGGPWTGYPAMQDQAQLEGGADKGGGKSGGVVEGEVVDLDANEKEAIRVSELASRLRKVTDVDANLDGTPLTHGRKQKLAKDAEVLENHAKKLRNKAKVAKIQDVAAEMAAEAKPAEKAAEVPALPAPPVPEDGPLKPATPAPVEDAVKAENDKTAEAVEEERPDIEVRPRDREREKGTEYLHQGKGEFKAYYRDLEVRNPNARDQNTEYNTFLTKEDATQAAEQYKADTEATVPWWSKLTNNYQAKSDEAAILTAITSYSDAAIRWNKLAQKGATDEEIKAQLSFELGEMGSRIGGETQDVAYTGGANPRIWVGQMTGRGKATLSGQAIVKKVRELLSIPLPEAAAPVADDTSKARGSTKKALKTKKARATIAVEGEASHGEQFEVQDGSGEVAIRPDLGQGEAGQNPEGDGGQARRGEPSKRPGGGSASVHAESLPQDARLSVEKPIELSAKQRLDLNARALAILDKATDQITDADREILRQYTGVGGLQAEEEGVLNQHYTSYPVIKFMWDKLASMGVQLQGAQALEAAEGVGNFLGFKPEGVQFDAVELDERASKVASILYPNVKHYNSAFEKFVPNHGYDISIGNDPFGNFRGKERYAEEAVQYQDIEQIHDFFIMKRIDLLNPNGVLAVITSTGTMDKKDPKNRAAINAKAEFLGAYRLPQGTFKKNAGFEGSVDVLFFRKRVAEELGKKDLLQDEFILSDTTQAKASGDYSANVNISSYYKAHPEKLLGELVAGGRYQNRAEVKAKGDLQKALDKAMKDEIKLVPKATKISKAQGGYIEDKPAIGEAPKGVPVGAYVVHKGKLATVGSSGKLFDTGKPLRGAARVEAAIELMNEADALINHLRENGEIDRKLQSSIKKKAAAYHKDNKVAPGYDRTLAFLRDDPRYYKLAGLMSADGKLADVLTKTSIFPKAKAIKPAKAGSLQDAVRFAQESGKGSDVAFIAKAYGKELEYTTSALIRSGWNEADGAAAPDSDYLFGDLWPKIDAAEAAGLVDQVAKLKAVLPEQRTIKDVPASILYTWIPQQVRDGFLAWTGIGGSLRRSMNADTGRLEWKIENGAYGSMKELAVNQMTPRDVVLKYINHEKIYSEDADGNRFLDRKATEALAATDVQFEKYLRIEHPDPKSVVDAYNRGYRSFRRKAPDSSPADLPGISETFKGRPLVVKSHQWEWVRQAVDTMVGINAHGVGGGKTMAGALTGQAFSVMKGAKRKLYAVPAKVIQKWAYEIQQIFPSAKVFSLENLDSNNAYKVLQQVAMNEFDFALISHDRLKMIPLKSGEKFLAEDIALLRERLNTIAKSKERKSVRSKRDVQEALAKAEEKLRGLQQMAKTKTIWWEDLGIDLLSVDEAHNFKRVNVDWGAYSNDSSISGGNQSSDRANDLYYKTREMRDRNSGNIFFYTATPTTNRPIEIYSMVRYLAPQEWTDRGIMNAGDFIDHFANIKAKLVPDLDGVLVEKSLITGYKNLHDLRAIVSKYVDFRPVADLKEVSRPDASYHVIEVPISKDQQRILAKIVADLEFVARDPNAAALEGLNRMSLTTAGRQAAVGADIYDAGSYKNWVEKDSKIAYVVDRIAALNKEHGAGQLVFLDMFRGYAKGARLSAGELAAAKAAGVAGPRIKPEVLVNYHEKIRDMLVARGFKAAEIAIINGEVNNTPSLKQKVQNDYNEGKLKIVIGSTTSMGEGMDLQADTVAIHNMDIPWTPAALEQRNGRGLRQGNKNELVQIFNYMTKGSLDAFMYGKLAVKDKWNKDLWTGTFDEVDNGLNNDEVEGLDFETLSKNMTVDRPTLEYWKKVREGDIERGLQEERAKKIEGLTHRIQIRHRDIETARAMIETYRQRQITEPSQLNSDRVKSHTENIQRLNSEILDLEKENQALKAEQEAGKSKLEIPVEPGKEAPPPKSLGSAAASDFGDDWDKVAYSLPSKITAAKDIMPPPGSETKMAKKGAKGEIDDIDKANRLVFVDFGTGSMPVSLDEISEAKPLAKAYSVEFKSLGSAAATDFEGQEPPAEELHPTENVDPDGVDSALAGSIPPPPPPKKPKGKGAGGEKPGRGWSFENKEAEKRYQAARKGVTVEGWVSRAQSSVRELWASMTTEFEGLPRTPEFSRARYELHRVKKQNAVAQDRAIRVLETMIRPMDEVDLEIFQRAILLRDLAREDAAGHELPFGFKKGEPQAEIDRMKPILDERERAWSAIVRRQSIWDGIKADYIKAMADIGFNVKERLQNEDYFRHQVLLYANQGREFRNVGKGGIRTPSGRGFLKKRGGSTLDINANYAEAEFEVMAQMLKDVEIAKSIKIIKDTYDIAPSLKAAAKAQNQAAMDAVMKAEEPVTMIGPLAVGATELQMRKYGQNIAYGFKLVHDAIIAGEIDPKVAEKWDKVIANFGSEGTAADNDGPISAQEVRSGDPNVFKFLAELSAGEGPGTIGARLIFKAIAARKEFIKTTLGDQFKEWRDIVPETHALWQPREGNIFYFVDTVSAKIAQQIHNEVAESVGITKQDLARALAMGGPRAEYAIPVQLADALDLMNSPVTKFWATELMKNITGAWKQWQLISPKRVIKYNLRNMTGDADAAFVGNPDSFKWVQQAFEELRPAFFGLKSLEGEIREFHIRGGFETTLRAQEIGDLRDVEILSRLFEQKDKSVGEKGADFLKKAWNKVALVTDFRETILRYASYRSYLSQLESGGLKNYGASVKENIDALPDNRDKAFKLANDLLGAYDEVSVNGQWLREHLIPFWSWKEVNFRRYVQLFKNAQIDDGTASRLTRQLGATGATQAARAGGFLMKATAFWVMLQLYNHLVWPDEEAQLDAYQRNRAHIILWREGDGKVAYFTGVGALGDFLGWFGLDAAPLLVNDYFQGKRTALEVAKEMGKAPFNIVAQGITPWIKQPAELAAQKQFFPDVFSPRPIRDNAQYLFRSVALGDEYNALFGVPSRGYLDGIKNMLYYRMDPGQGSYLDITNQKRKFMAKQGISHDGGNSSPKGEALYMYKMAVRYDDKDLQQRYLRQYIMLGGNAQGVRQGLMNMGPLSGLTIRQKAEFLHSLNQDDKVRLRAAETYWSEVLMGRSHK